MRRTNLKQKKSAVAGEGTVAVANESTKSGGRRRRRIETDEAPASDKKPMALRLTDDLREEILNCSPGQFLGGEPELLARYGVSRPTFRQVARLLEQEQLLSVRRGPGGGYYARAPQVDSVRRAATTYLRSRHTTREHIADASSFVFTALVGRAARSNDEDGRRELAKQRARLIAAGDAQDINEFDELGHAFGTSVAHLAANPALELQLAILHQVAREETRRTVVAVSADRQAAIRALRIRMADAILAREPEVAEVLSGLANRLMKGWQREDLGSGDASEGDWLQL